MRCPAPPIARGHDTSNSGRRGTGIMFMVLAVVVYIADASLASQCNGLGALTCSGLPNLAYQLRTLATLGAAVFVVIGALMTFVP
jgi:hypothetical protein